jgi:PAS domain-containing protein
MTQDSVWALVHRIYGGAAHAEYSPAFSDDARLKFEVPVALLPHIERARAIRERLRDESRTSRRLSALCDALPVAVVMMTDDRVIVQANARARAALRSSRLVVSIEGRFKLVDAATDSRLSAVLASLAAARGDHRATLAARDADGAPFQLRIQRDADAAQPGPAYIVQIFEAATTHALSPSSLRECFGLNALEVQVCQLVFKGRSLEDATATLTPTCADLDALVASVLAKCGARSASELVRNLALSAAVE